MKPQYLLTPGPTPVPPSVLKVLSEPIFHHRTPAFQAVFRDVNEGLKAVFQTTRDVFTLAGSGTLAMEASFVNFFSRGEHILVVRGGKFGERFGEIAERFGLLCDYVDVEWGKAVDPKKIASALAGPQGKEIRGVFTTLCETSTGVVNDIQAIGQLTAQTRALLVVDVISGLVADPFRMDAWSVDIAVCGSQKGLMIPPGLAFLAASERAWQRLEDSNIEKYYLDLRGYKKALAKTDTPFTSALTLILALQEALRLIREEGVEQVIARTARLAEATRAAVTALGLVLFAEQPSNVLTAVRVPRGVDGKALVKVMRDELSVSIAGGQAELAGKIFRLAHLGYIQASDVQAGLEALVIALNRLGFTCQKEAALQTFKQRLGTSCQKINV